MKSSKDPQAPKGFMQLFISKRLIHGAATALMGVFFPIFLFTVFNEQFYLVGLFYAVVSLLYILGIVPGMRLMNAYGFKTALILGGVFCTFSYIFVLCISNDMGLWPLVFLLGISMTAFRIFHWVPYHVDFTMFTRNGARGRSVGVTYATIAFMGIVGPILAGYIITQSGYNTLFIVAATLMLCATVSYGFVPNTNEKFTWTFTQTWKQLLSKKYRSNALGLMAYGAESTFTILVWPIFLYILLQGNVLEVGAVSTFVAGITIILQLVLGYLLDGHKLDSGRTLRMGSYLNAVGWIVKIFVLSAVQIFFVGLYHSIAKIFTQTPFDTMLYDMSADQGHYVDEFTALREMSIHIGRGLAILAVALLTLYVSIQWTFIIGAVASLLINIMYRVNKAT